MRPLDGAAAVRVAVLATVCAAVRAGIEQRRRVVDGRQRNCDQGRGARAERTAVLVARDPFALPINQATRQAGTFVDAVLDATAVFDYAGFETWGRTVEVAFVPSAGNDEAAQRADAAAVVAQQPFAVIVPLPSLTGGIGGPIFERAVADRKIVVIGYPTTRRKRSHSSRIGGR